MNQHHCTSQQYSAEVRHHRSIEFAPDTIVMLRTPEGVKETLLVSATLAYELFTDTDEDEPARWNVADAVHTVTRRRLASGKWGTPTTLPLTHLDPTGETVLYSSALITDLVAEYMPTWIPNLHDAIESL